MSTGTSTFVIRWINFLTMMLAIAVISFGLWMSTHHDECRKSLTLPVMGLGALILLLSVIGFVGALKNITILLWVYLVLLCLILVAILVFTVLAFIITNSGSGHAVAGLRYKEYHLQDYNQWFLKQLNDTQKWIRLKSCLVKSEDCDNFPKKYKTIKEYKLAELTPIESGCCRPPSECGYPAVNASYYDLSYHPVSTNRDCKLYKNARSVKCYNCGSCKAGAAQYMKAEWRVVAIFNLILFVVLGSDSRIIKNQKPGAETQIQTGSQFFIEPCPHLFQPLVFHQLYILSVAARGGMPQGVILRKFEADDYFSRHSGVILGAVYYELSNTFSDVQFLQRVA